MEEGTKTVAKPAIPWPMVLLIAFAMCCMIYILVERNMYSKTQVMPPKAHSVQTLAPPLDPTWTPRPPGEARV